jgi:hypothetical protein
MSRQGVLADREELWSNPLCVGFQRLRITLLLVNTWKKVILQGAEAGPVRGLQSGLRS